jgi:hydroxyethylthiazole kinase
MESLKMCAEALTQLRCRAPRVHCITNNAAAAYSANVLLAVGATPSLSLAEQEIGDFVSTADALLINIGTMDAERDRAIELALGVAQKESKPWVLDPVMVDRSAFRLKQAKRLLDVGPDVIRGNSTEIDALATAVGASGPAGLAKCTGATVVQTGVTDIVCRHGEAVTIQNGHPLMSRVTAVGCAGGALVAAFLALQHGAFSAAWEATLTLDVAGEVAGSEARGPGSLQFGLLDALSGLDVDQFAALARIQWLDQEATRTLGGLKPGDSV